MFLKVLFIIIMIIVLLTVQCEHRWDSLAVRYTSGVRYAVFPQVGEIVRSGQDYTVHLRPCPNICGHCRADQDPPRNADHKAADLHVHHHSPVIHVCCKVRPLRRKKTDSNKCTKLPVLQRNGLLCCLNKAPPQMIHETQKHQTNTDNQTSGKRQDVLR